MEKLTKKNYDEVMKNEVVLVDYWATWCGPCRSFGPIFEEVAKDFEGKVTFLKCNVDEEQELAIKQGVMSIPCVIAYKNGQPVDKQIGIYPKDAFKKFVEKQL